jgi:hypothetical protein
MKHRLLPILPVFALLTLLGIATNSSAADLAEIIPLTPADQMVNRAGMCYSFYPDGGSDRPFIPLAYQAGSRWDRFDFVWPNLEREDGSWKDEGRQAYDTLVNDLTGAGFDMVGILLWTPNWAATSGVTASSAPEDRQRPPGWYAPVPGGVETYGPLSVGSISSSPPKGLGQPWDDWTTGDGDPINYWGRFVHKVVDRYGDRVKHWEMWNEPEWTYFWTGTPSDYARLLKVGYQATKAACEDCQVLFGGLHYWADKDYHKEVLNALADDPDAPTNDYFFDIMSLHLYSRSSNTYEVVNDVRSHMREVASVHPIWLTETGVPIWDDASVDPHPDKYDYAATRGEAAAYLIQSYANAWASGVERYFFFRTHDADMWEYFGLIRNDRSLRPAYSAYQVAATHLVSPTMTTRTSYGVGVQRVTLWGTPQGKVSVLWNTTPGTFEFEYPATLSTARVVNRRGDEQIVAATDGVYRLSLPGATANLVSDPDDYFIGGEPLLVIEEDTTAPSKAVVGALPSTTDPPSLTINCSASDDAAGIWGYELEVQKNGGTWRKWGRIHSAPILFSDGEAGATYCFRVRAWDRAGNPGPWADREPCTTIGAVPAVRKIQVKVTGVFADGNGNKVQDEGEATVTNASFRFLNQDGNDVVDPGTGSSWAFETKVGLGDYILLVSPADWFSPPPGWLPRHVPVHVGAGEEALIVDEGPVGLLRHRSSSFFPVMARNGVLGD